jgi:hypothetical protein
MASPDGKAHIMKMTMRYLGTNTLACKKEGATILIDPHFTRPGFMRLPFGLRPDPLRVAEGLRMAEIDQLEAVLLTHTHYDHAIDMPLVIQQVGGEVYGSQSACKILQGASLAEEIFHPVKPGEVYQIGPFSLRFHPARHIPFPLPLGWLMPETGKISEPLKPPVPFWAYRPGEVYAIQVDDILVFGSAGFEPGAYADLGIETVILGIGGLETMPEVYLRRLYEEAVLASGAQRVWLSHWDNFFRPLSKKLIPFGFSNRTVQRLQALGKAHGQVVAKLPFIEMVDR